MIDAFLAAAAYGAVFFFRYFQGQLHGLYYFERRRARAVETYEVQAHQEITELDIHDPGGSLPITLTVSVFAAALLGPAAWEILVFAVGLYFAHQAGNYHFQRGINRGLGRPDLDEKEGDSWHFPLLGWDIPKNFLPGNRRVRAIYSAAIVILAVTLLAIL